ncbi:hypothetical protein D9757_001221 [Collybiopsis confluens]|uniref:Peptidase S53 domain-containing protein n=1 Tax=Collybiopsis confluens TaxID=2823264 RepID=A0A8H5I122_9AGAR|nr:hypothetical protein D9757_001221 [Collybiopsis confluens]
MRLLELTLLSLAALGLAERLGSFSRLKQTVQPRKLGQGVPRIASLQKALLEISDPDHERYGQHLSKAEVEFLVSPDERSIQLVNDWLDTHGIPSDAVTRTPAEDWVIVQVSVQLAEEMLDTTYHIWQHDEGSSMIRTTRYSLPEHLHKHIDLVQPTTTFARPARMKSTMYRTKTKAAVGDVTDVKFSEAAAVNCNNTVTLACLQTLYKTAGYESKASSKNSIGITGYLGEYANEEDLNIFYADQRPEARNSSFDVVLVNGGLNPQSAAEAGDEANLDVQFAFGLGFPAPGTFYSTGGEPPFHPDAETPSNTNEPYEKWLDYVLAMAIMSKPSHKITPVVHVRDSWSWLAYLIGCRGVTLLFSSGDGGVGDNDPDPTTQQCVTNDGRNQTRFLPVFPASKHLQFSFQVVDSILGSVTSVGGTQGIPEEAFPRPWYQEEAVEGFLRKLGNTYDGLFNRFGRVRVIQRGLSDSCLLIHAIHFPYFHNRPYVSAQGLNFRVFIGSKPYLISGTSASSPTFAGIVALLNDVRLSAKLPPLGFLNPLLYKRGVEGLNDVLVGSNPGCGTGGFHATEGWDPVTGLGTPNFEKLRRVVLHDT